jgi:hypothetical protein
MSNKKSNIKVKKSNSVKTKISTNKQKEKESKVDVSVDEKNKEEESDSININFDSDDKERSFSISEFLKISESAVRKHGIDKVTLVLSNLDIQTEIQNLDKEKLVNFIIESIINEFKSDNITKRDLFFRSKRGEVALARKMCIVLMRQYLSELSDTQLGKYFGRTRQVIFYTMEEFKAMNPKNIQHAYFLKKHSNICDKVQAFIEQESGVN